MQLAEALDQFLVQLEADGRSAHTRRQYRRHVLALARWMDRAVKVALLTPEDLARFLTSDEARGRPDGAEKRATSVNALRTSLRCFFGYLHQAGLIDSNPARLLKRAITGTPPPRALTEREQERLLAALAEARGDEELRDATLFRLMLRTGIRLSSALALDIEDVDLDEGVLAIWAKGDRRERVYLSEGIRDELQGYLAGRDSGPVFASQAGRRITARHAQRRFRAWRDRAGLPEAVSPHALRHTYATRLYERTGDVALVQRALGHRAISSTLRYAQASEERVRGAVRT